MKKEEGKKGGKEEGERKGGKERIKEQWRGSEGREKKLEE